MPKYLDIQEFTDFGYLHEVNRRLLHPLGLALEVVVEDDGTHRLGGVWDYRDDPEGITFAPDTLDPAKVARVQAEIEKRWVERVNIAGYWEQPVPKESAS